MRLQVAFDRAYAEVLELVQRGVLTPDQAREHALHKALADWRRARRRVRRRQAELPDEDDDA